MPPPSCAISHTRGHLHVSRFARWTTEKRETARSLESPWYLRLYGIFGLVILGKGQRVQKEREKKDKSSHKLLKLFLPKPVNEI